MVRRSVEREQEEIVLELLRRHAQRLATSFSLQLHGLSAESSRVKRRYGICYEDGTIRLRLRNVRTGGLLRESSLVDTLCHELAHLRYFDHGRQFQRLYERILAYARRHGIYRPGHASRWRVEPAPPAPMPPREPSASVVARRPRPAAEGAPEQLELF